MRRGQVWKGFKRRPVFVYESEKMYSYILKGSSVKSVLSEHGHNFIYSSLRIEEITATSHYFPGSYVLARQLCSALCGDGFFPLVQRTWAEKEGLTKCRNEPVRTRVTLRCSAPAHTQFGAVNVTRTLIMNK